jgi:hypothetical protein
VTFDEMEAALRARLEALPPAARAELIHVLRLPDFERADAIGTSPIHDLGATNTPNADRPRGGRHLKAVIWGLLREMERE